MHIENALDDAGQAQPQLTPTFGKEKAITENGAADNRGKMRKELAKGNRAKLG